jgi:signal transduction histidine kinase
MTSGSLRVRLAAFSALAISLLLGLAGLAFGVLFERHVERFAINELNTHFEQLAAGLAFSAEGKLEVDVTLSDPRFEQPGGGLYWQIDAPGVTSIRSRSMWDEQFSVPTPPTTAEEDHAHIMKGPNQVDVLALEKMVRLSNDKGVEVPAVITIAMDRARVSNAVTRFGRDLGFGLIALYIGLLAATLGMVYLGMNPLQSLKLALQKLRSGETDTLSGNFPEEVSPLVDEVNALLSAREKQLERARQRAGNLAHGLKTPLTVLAAVAGDLEKEKQREASQNIRLAAGQMRDLVDRELARSRMSLADVSHRADLTASVKRVVDTLKRAPKGESITWMVDIPAPTFVSMDQTDLLELLGNLIDNARKHTNSRIRVAHDGAELVIEDDGPGVPPEKRTAIARRGVKLDALAPGSGLGLSIVSDLADVYDFAIGFDESQWGGLKVTIGLAARS